MENVLLHPGPDPGAEPGPTTRRALMTDPTSRREALRGHAAVLLFAVLISGSFSLGHMAAGRCG